MDYVATYFESPSPFLASLPFSEAVQVGSLLYLSGQLGVDDTGEVVVGGVQAETKQAMDNIRGVLARRGLTFDNVVKCLVMLADMSEWSAMNEVYLTFFDKDRLPARSAMGVGSLARDARLEIECIAEIAPKAKAKNKKITKRKK
jgi:reactive intermediate/imine deaminase